MKSKQDEAEYLYKEECLDEIKTLEKQGHIDLYYGDQSGFCLTPVMAYCWQYAGEQVEILPQKGKRINVFGLMSQGCKLTSFSKEGSLNAQFMVDSIDQWVKTITKVTVLVLDNAPVHQAKLFKAKIQQWQEQNLFVFFLPAYSPHLNKIEMLWRKMKYEWLKPHSYLSLENLWEALNEILMHFGEKYFITFKD